MADGTDGPSGRDEVTDELHGVGVQPQRIGVGDATRQDESVVFVDRRIGDGDVDVERLGLSRWLNAWAFPASGASSLAVAPASVTAFQGSVCSTCSMPSFATRKAMVYPLRSCAMGTQRSFVIDFTCGVPEAGSQKRGRPRRRLGGATPPSGERLARAPEPREAA